MLLENHAVRLEGPFLVSNNFDSHTHCRVRVTYYDSCGKWGGGGRFAKPRSASPSVQAVAMYAFPIYHSVTSHCGLRKCRIHSISTFILWQTITPRPLKDPDAPARTVFSVFMSIVWRRAVPLRRVDFNAGLSHFLFIMLAGSNQLYLFPHPVAPSLQITNITRTLPRAKCSYNV